MLGASVQGHGIKKHFCLKRGFKKDLAIGFKVERRKDTLIILPMIYIQYFVLWCFECYLKF